MTAPVIALRRPEAGVVAQLADCVRELAVRAGAGCLVEASDGRLLAHHLLTSDVDPVLVDVLVSGSLAPLDAALTARRTIGVLPSGPVIEGRHGAHAVVQVAWRGGGAWLLMARSASLGELAEPIARLMTLLTCASGAPRVTCLEGGPLPPELASAELLCVARLVTDASSDTVLVLLEGLLAGEPIVPVRVHESVYLVGGCAEPDATRLRRDMRRAHERARRAVADELTTGLSVPCDPSGLAGARQQADAAAAVASPGACVAVEAVRAELILEYLGGHLADAPDLGPDPLLRLRDYDRRRGSDLEASLLGWLNAGDVPSAADALGLHHNTLRYRLRRVAEILGTDLRHDPAARALLHVRLLTGQPTGEGFPVTMRGPR